MSSRFDKWLKPILEEVYQEMFPTPPTIEGQPRPRPMPPPEAPPVELPAEPYPPVEKQVVRPRVERVERPEPALPVEREVIRPRIERIEPEELLERDIRRPRTVDIVERPERRPVVTPRVAPPRTVPKPALRQLLGSQTALRQAILVQEILGPPKALRTDDQRRS